MIIETIQTTVEPNVDPAYKRVTFSLTDLTQVGDLNQFVLHMLKSVGAPVTFKDGEFAWYEPWRGLVRQIELDRPLPLLIYEWKPCMTIEVVAWPANTEVRLIHPDNFVEARFYTSATRINFEGFSGEASMFDAEAQFNALRSMCPPPHIAGPFADFHPYSTEHPERKAMRDAERLAKHE